MLLQSHAVLLLLSFYRHSSTSRQQKHTTLAKLSMTELNHEYNKQRVCLFNHALHLNFHQLLFSLQVTTIIPSLLVLKPDSSFCLFFICFVLFFFSRQRFYSLNLEQKRFTANTSKDSVSESLSLLAVSVVLSVPCFPLEVLSHN